jgi:hypothetical protein
VLHFGDETGEEMIHVGSTVGRIACKLKTGVMHTLKVKEKVMLAMTKRADACYTTESVGNEDGADAWFRMLGGSNTAATCQVRTILWWKIALGNRPDDVASKVLDKGFILDDIKEHGPVVPAPLIYSSPFRIAKNGLP